LIKSDKDPDINIEKYFSLYDNSSYSIALIDLSGKIIHINPATEDLLGFKRDELVGKNLLDLTIYPLEDLPKIEYNFQKLRASQTLEPFEIRIYDKLGYQIWISAIAIEVILQDAIYFKLIIQDINEKKKIEGKLRDTEERNKTLINNIIDILIEMDLNGIITYVSPQVYNILGYKPEELIGEKSFDLIHPDDIERVRKTLEESINWGTYVSYDHRIKHRNDYYVPISMIGNLINHGNSYRIIGILRDLSYQKEAERKIKESTEKYKKIINNLDIAFFRATFNGILLASNPKFNEIFGFNKDEHILGRDIKDLLASKEDRENFIQELRDKGFVQNYILPGKKITGEKIYAQYNVRIIKNKKNIAAGIEGTFIDITNKVKLEQKLRETTEKFKNLFEHSVLGIVILDLEGKFADINYTLEKMIGYSRDELLGTDFFKFIGLPEEMVPLLRKRFQLYSQGKQLKPIELQIKKKDGTKIWIAPSVSLIKLNNTPYIQIYIQNITARKLSEIKLKESEEKFRIIAEQSFLGIGIYQNDVFQYINQQFADIIGAEIREIMKWPPKKIFKYVHPQNRDFVAEQARKKQIGEKDAVTHYQAKGFRYSGEPFWFEIYSKTINYLGKPADLITIMDITEQKKIEEKVLEAEKIIKNENKRLKEIDKLRKDFINRASHELKNPLTAIYGATQLLKLNYGYTLNQEASDLINMISKNGKRLQNLITDLLDASKIESKKYNINKKNANISILIKECIDDMEYFIKQKEIDLILNIIEDVFIKIDEFRIRQVIINLLSNAIKYNRDKGKIWIRLKKKDGFIEFCIKDNGVGITDEEMKELFKEFSNFHKKGERPSYPQESTGLGLYISKKIIELHGGEIYAQSEGYNKGTTFFVKLPFI